MLKLLKKKKERKPNIDNFDVKFREQLPCGNHFSKVKIKSLYMCVRGPFYDAFCVCVQQLQNSVINQSCCQIINCVIGQNNIANNCHQSFKSCHQKVQRNTR